MKRVWILPVALLALNSLASAAIINWTYNGTTAASNSWGNDASWSAIPAWDGTDDIVLDGTILTTDSRTLTIDGDRTINSLKATVNSTNRGFTVNPGTGGKITINTGNIYVDGTKYASNSGPASPLNLSGTVVQIGNGTTAVTNAVWDLSNLGIYGTGNGTRGRTQLTMGEFTGIENTVVTVTGSYAPAPATGGGSTLRLTKSSNSWLGTLAINSTPAVTVQAEANNALGAAAATVDVKSFTVFQLINGSSQEAAFDLNYAGDVYFAATTAGQTATINGNLSGVSNLMFNKNGTASTLYGNTVVFNGDSTVSGNITVNGGTLRVNGDWTGAGNVLVNYVYNPAGNKFVLEGTGSIALAADKKVTFKGNDHELATKGTGSDAFCAPGTDGTIGTLSLGTSGTGKVLFDARSFLKLDFDGESADQLAVTGDLDLNQTVTLSKGNGLVLNALSELTAESYTLVTYSGTLTGTFAEVWYNGSLVADPAVEDSIAGKYQLDYSTPGEIRLVQAIPEPSTLGLVVLGGIAALIRRRR